MNNFLLYVTTIFSWSFTWLAIKYQLGVVSPVWSVAYRFGLAGILLLGFCIISGRSLKFTFRQHMTILLQGICLFSINFLFFYLGAQYLISGIAAVIFASITAVNIINARLFFKTPITFKLVAGTVLGCLGLILVFWSEVFRLIEQPEQLKTTIIGLIFCLLGVFVASLGNMLSKYNQNQKISVLDNNALGMCYGALVLSGIAILIGQPIGFDMSFSYISSLFYLAVVGSILGFGCYLKLLGNIGPERVGYVFIIVPIMAMIISTFAEEFQWTIHAVIGLSLIVLGNVFVLAKRPLAILKSHDELRAR